VLGQTVVSKNYIRTNGRLIDIKDKMDENPDDQAAPPGPHPTGRDESTSELVSQAADASVLSRTVHDEKSTSEEQNLNASADAKSSLTLFQTQPLEALEPNTGLDQADLTKTSAISHETKLNKLENDSPSEQVHLNLEEKKHQHPEAIEVMPAPSSTLAEEQVSGPDKKSSSASSPNSGSTSGLDSGVSPDDSSPDTAKSNVEMKSHADEVQTADKPKSVEVGPLETVDQSESPCHTQPNLSPDANTSVSETQVTVSDLDSPPAEASASASNVDQESVYYIKWITFGQANVPIITQNENGPCPLLAIMNVLLLKGKVKLAPMIEMVTSEQLMTYLGDCIFENMPQNLSTTSQANYEQNMQDAMSVMYKLQTGLDVNVKFTGVADFEYTPELIIFDLLEISLYHGWLVDPQDPDTVQAVNQDSYNQLVEKIILLKHSDKEENITQALIAEQFLERSASQLTYHGLCELSSVVKEKELCVFFRNNHFSTLHKQNNELFQLVTDQGFLTESNVVWETLSTVDGDCHFTDATFRTYTKPPASIDPIPDPSVAVGSPEQIDHDYQVALFLQEEASSALNPTWASGFQQEPTAPYTQTDHDLAMRLQEEEDRRERAEQQQRPQQASAPQPSHGRVPPVDP
ncbi:unnamed protein product, partial [Lymnaea stagnalis]